MGFITPQSVFRFGKLIGGIFVASKSYAAYSVYVDFTKSTRDQVSKELLNATGLAATRYGYDGGEFGAGEAVIEDDGLLGYGAYTNGIAQSEDCRDFTTIGVTTTIDFIAENNLSMLHGCYKSTEGSTGDYVIWQVSAKDASRVLQLTFGLGVVSGNPYANFDLVNGTVTNYGLHRATIEGPSDDGFYKCTVGDTSIVSLVNITVALCTSLSSNRVESYQGDGTSGVYIKKIMSNIGKYLLPYVKTEGTAVSVPENYSTTDQGPRFRIRDTAAGEVMMPETLDALDGAADGEELVVNGGFDTDSDWQKSSGWSIDGSKAVSFGATGSIFQNTGLTIGAYYEIVYTISDYVSGNLFVKLGTSSSNNITTSGTYIERMTASGDTYLRINPGIAFYGSISSISIKEISPAQATIPYKWRPMFNAGDLGTTQNIVTANDEADTFLYYDDVNEMIKASDGTNTSEVACSPVADTEYEIEVSYNSAGLQISVDGIAGTVVSFVGSVPAGDYISHGWEAEAPQYVKRMTATEGVSELVSPFGNSVLSSGGTEITSGGESLTSGGVIIWASDT